MPQLGNRIGIPQRGRSVDSKFLSRSHRYSSPFLVKEVAIPPFSGVTVKAYSPSVRVRVL